MLAWAVADVLPVVMVAVSVIGHMAAVGTAFGLKRQIGCHHGHVHAAQHVGQHMVGFNLQVVGLQLNRHMAVAQVVGGTHQVKGRAVRGAGGDLQHALGAAIARISDPSSATSTSPPRTAWPRGRKMASSRPWLSVAAKRDFWRTSQSQLDGGGALQQHFGQALALGRSLWMVNIGYFQKESYRLARFVHFQALFYPIA